MAGQTPTTELRCLGKVARISDAPAGDARHKLEGSLVRLLTSPNERMPRAWGGAEPPSAQPEHIAAMLDLELQSRSGIRTRWAGAVESWAAGSETRLTISRPF